MPPTQAFLWPCTLVYSCRRNFFCYLILMIQQYRTLKNTEFCQQYLLDSLSFPSVKLYIATSLEAASIPNPQEVLDSLMSDSLMIPQHELFRVAFHTLEMSLIFSKKFHRSLLSVVGLDIETQCLTTHLKQKMEGRVTCF